MVQWAVALVVCCCCAKYDFEVVAGRRFYQQAMLFNGSFSDGARSR